VTPPDDGNDPGAGTPGEDGGVAAADLPDAAPPPPPRSPVTFVIKNDGKTDLTFALDKGWGASLFAYTGKPPKATSIQVFPKYCTGSCDLPPGNAEGESCPICKEAEDPKERQKEEKAETKREIVAPGATFELGWDGQAVVYEKAAKEIRGKNKKCECWRPAPPPAGTYTIKACGLRTASEVGKTSKFDCVETTVDLPVPEGQTVDVVLTFGAPAAPPAKGK
jgi:hypothetical protein